MRAISGGKGDSENKGEEEKEDSIGFLVYYLSGS